MIISEWKWCVVIVVSDETNIFEVKKLKHPNMKLWVQTPRADIDYNARVFGVGYGYAREYAPRFYEEYLNKTIDIYLSGQNTHARRNVIFNRLDEYKEKHKDLNIHVNQTAGFTQGYSQQMHFCIVVNLLQHT